VLLWNAFILFYFIKNSYWFQELVYFSVNFSMKTVSKAKAKLLMG